MRALILFISVTLLFGALTVHAETVQPPMEYTPEGGYAPGVKYVVLLPSYIGKSFNQKPSVFTGTFKPYTNSFSGVTFMIPDKGEYRDPRGLRFVGAFDYIPKRFNLRSEITEAASREVQTFAGGSFVFAGERFDDLAEEDEESYMSGIFVSQTELPLTKNAFVLVEATPDYVQKLAINYREALVADQEHREAVKEYAAKVEKERFTRLLNFASGALNMFGGVSNLTGHLGKLGSIGNLGNVGNLRNLGSVGALAGDLTRKMDMASMTLQMVKGVVTDDQSLGDVLSGAVGDKMKELIRQKGGAESETLINTLDLLVKEGK